MENPRNLRYQTYKFPNKTQKIINEQSQTKKFLIDFQTTRALLEQRKNSKLFYLFV